MAHGKNATYNHNKAWTGRRPLSWLTIKKMGMSFFKRQTHKLERRLSKAEITKDIELG